MRLSNSIAGLSLAVCVLSGLPGCLPSESDDGPTVVGTGDAGPGTGGQGAGGATGGANGPTGGTPSGNGGPPWGLGGEAQPGGDSGGGGLPWGNGGQPQPGGDPATGGQAQPGGDPGTGGMQSCEPDCRGRVCGPDGCGGTCGRGCADGEVCSDGQCSAEGCPADLIDCNGECSTLLDDVNHCGNCRTACPTNDAAGAVPVCIEAECYLTCRGGENRPQSIDFENDPENCGRCGNACGEARNGRPQCAGGRCLDPCENGDTLCQGRCVRNDRIGENCNDACCPVVRPGEHRGAALEADSGRAYTIEVDGARRVRARLRFDDGSCPGFESPFDTANEFVTFGIATVDDLGNRPLISRAREGLGLGEDCMVTDAQVTVGGAYEVVLSTRRNLPAHTLTIEVLPPAPARAGAQTIDRTGVYAKAIPENGRASFPVRVATPQHVIILATSDDVNNGYPEACLFGEIGLEINENNFVDMDDTHCAVIEAVLPAGDYTLHAERTFGDADRSYRAVVFMEPIGGPAAVALPEGGYAAGRGLDAFEAAKYTFSAAGGGTTRIQLQSPNCEIAGFRVPELPWGGSDPGDPCGPVDLPLEAGEYTLWVHGARWNPLPEFAVQVDGAGGGGNGGDVIDRAGDYERGAIPQGGSDRMTLRLGARRDVILFTGDGNGGCPADTTLTLMQNGVQVAYDDDGNGRCSRISESLAAGDYEVIVQGYSGAAVPAYVLTASF